MKKHILSALVALITLSSISFAESQLATDVSKLVRLDLSSQTGEYYKNGKVVRRFNISSGILSAPTPTGRDKQIVRKGSLDGRSSTRYSSTFEVNMPDAMEIDFRDGKGELRGICMHAGNLPGYPSSHACIRLEPADAKFLYGECDVGTRVEITGSVDKFYTEHFVRKDLLVIDGLDIKFKRNSDNTLTKAFIAACKENTLKLCRFKPGSETELTTDRSKWVIGFPFMERKNCVSLMEYEAQINESVFVIKKK